MTLISEGNSGVASAAILVLAAVLSAVHQIPLAGLVFLLGADRLTTPIRAALNGLWQLFDAVAVARWERAYDPEIAERVLSKCEDQDDA